MADDGKNKRLATLGGSFILLIAVAGTVAAILTTHNPGSPAQIQPVATSSKSINSICETTDYKATCVNALHSVASNVTDPRQLIQSAFEVTVNHIHSAINNSATLKALAKDPSTSAALKNCEEMLDYAIHDLKNSIDHMTNLDLSALDMMVEDITTWLSAVITYQETCLDGFDNATSPAAVSMRKALNITHQLTSNALAMSDELSSVVKQFGLPNLSRRLLSDGLPSWMSSGSRRLLQTPTNKIVPNVVVSTDGSSKFKSINEALKLVPKKNYRPFVIYIKEGVYKEKVVVCASCNNVMMIGDGPTKTKITGSLNYIDGVKTFDTASFTAIGNNFVAKNIGFENSAGAAKHQAVALLVQSDKAVFYNCQMDGYQDTLYAHSHRQFYRECTISGTIDFIFGDAISYFQNCQIVVRKPLDNQQNIVTAQGRKQRRQRTGIILHNCTISADPAYEPFKNKMPTYLGRPWKDFSRTYIMQSNLGDLIHPDGWLPWDGQMYLNTLTYSEFDNRGPGAVMEKRVKWKGVKNSNIDRAQKFSSQGFMRAGDWVPRTGVPVNTDLLDVKS